MSRKGFTTRILHAPFSKKDPHGAIKIPVYDTASYEFDTSRDLEDAFTGKIKAHQYSRGSNPTVEHFEMLVKDMTDSHSVLALSSGLAAISNSLLAICGAGDNIIASNHLFGNTYSMFTSTLPSLGIDVQFARMSDLEEVKSRINENTRAIFLETITNPQLEVADIKEVAQLANDHGIVLICDATMTPPCFFSSREYGAHVEIISSTKFFSGGGTSIGGLIIDNGLYDWSKNHKTAPLTEKFGENAYMARLRKEIFRNFGACLSPHNAYLQALGLETLELRASRAVGNAMELAKWLENNDKIKAVNYPGLPSSPFHELAMQQFSGKPGSLLTFSLENKTACYQFMDRLQTIKRATNLSDNRTLIIHPSSTIYCEYSEESKKFQDIDDGMMRVTVGIEDVADLINDISGAL